MESTDMELVREYATLQSDSAFAKLVARHADLVYSVALRQVRDPHLAEEVTQAVFLVLARKARTLGGATILPAWLCRTARYAAGNALRTRWRRKQREQEAYMQSLIPQPDSDSWEQIAPLLDAGMERLAQKEHDALVLRFFEGRNFGDVGMALGISGDAAKMRVNRALEKLRKFFGRRGVMLSVGGIASAVSAGSVEAAPAALKASLAAIAVARGAGIGAGAFTLAARTLRLMFWRKIATGGIVVVSIAVFAVVATSAVHAFGWGNASRAKAVVSARESVGKDPTEAKKRASKAVADLFRPFAVCIVDENGRPISSATIEFPLEAVDVGEAGPDNLPFLAAPGIPQVIHTDHEGRAVIPLPGKALDDVRAKSIRLLVRAPGFCFSYEPVSLAKPAPIVLRKGSRVVIRAKEAGSGKSIPAYADVGEIDGVGRDKPFITRMASWMRLEGDTIETHLEAGRYVISAIDFSATTPRYSLMRMVNLDGKTEQDLDFEVAEGVHVRGMLDRSVRRPVSNGLAIATILLPAENDSSTRGEWQASCPVAEDGTFDFGNLPVGELRLIVLCDGAVSIPSGGFDGVVHAQKFGSAPAMPIEVKMTKTGALHIKVTDDSGAPIPAADVSWFLLQSLGNSGSWTLGSTTADSAPVIRVNQDMPAGILPSLGKSNLDVMTDAQGEATIFNLPPMPLHVHVSAKGYERATLDDVRMRSGNSNTLNIRLKSKISASLHP